MLLLAREHGRRAENEEAVALLDQLVRKYPQSAEADEAAFLAARLQLDDGKLDDGRARLLQLADRRTASGAEARWSLAWLSYRAQKADAAERFAASFALATDDESRARATYWQARAGKPAQARALYQRALELDPLGWYGLLSRPLRAQTAHSRAAAFARQGRHILERGEIGARGLATDRCGPLGARLADSGSRGPHSSEIRRAGCLRIGFSSGGFGRRSILKKRPSIAAMRRACFPSCVGLSAGGPIRSLGAARAVAPAWPPCPARVSFAGPRREGRAGLDLARAPRERPIRRRFPTRWRRARSPDPARSLSIVVGGAPRERLQARCPQRGWRSGSAATASDHRPPRRRRPGKARPRPTPIWSSRPSRSIWAPGT